MSPPCLVAHVTANNSNTFCDKDRLIRVRCWLTCWFTTFCISWRCTCVMYLVSWRTWDTILFLTLNGKMAFVCQVFPEAGIALHLLFLDYFALIHVHDCDHFAFYFQDSVFLLHIRYFADHSRHLLISYSLCFLANSLALRASMHLVKPGTGRSRRSLSRVADSRVPITNVLRIKLSQRPSNSQDSASWRNRTTYWSIVSCSV